MTPRHTPALLAALLLAGPAAAQEAPPTVLVLDASNSMWGRVEGRAKIEIAREAVATLAGGLSPRARLGLVAYGHRRAGDCADIETLVAPAPLDQAGLAAATAALTPRGKTPLSAALRHAAGVLGAGRGGTVILVTDGIETCAADPCAVAEELKRADGGLVVHVVGFDLRDPAERARVACIAERTGGGFTAAGNAAELGAALRSTAAAKPKPAIPARPIALAATDGPGGKPLAEAVFSIRRKADGASVAEGASGSVRLAPGAYRVAGATAVKTGAVEVEVSERGPDRIVVPLTGALPKAAVTLPTPSVPATGTLEARWSGPDGPEDYLTVARPGGDPLETRDYARPEAGNPARLRVPGEPGDYEVRYVHGASGAVLARARFTATPVAATLQAPPQGQAGSAVTVAFTGPRAPEDWVGLAETGADAAAHLGGAWSYATEGGPVTLRLPAAPGRYEIRYVSGLDPKILAARTITVTPAAASLAAPGRGTAGSRITVAFRGEASGGDTFIGVVRRGAPAETWIGGAYERPQGAEVSLRLPGEPGDYEVRYVLESNGDYRILAAAPLRIDPAQASLAAPDRVRRGARVPVAFTGPRESGDFVTIVPVGAAPEAYEDWSGAERDGPVTLTAPDQPGAYEIRYVMSAPGDTGSQVVARKPLRVE